MIGIKYNQPMYELANNCDMDEEIDFSYIITVLIVSNYISKWLNRSPFWIKYRAMEIPRNGYTYSIRDCHGNSLEFWIKT